MNQLQSLLRPDRVLPRDASALLVGRAWIKGAIPGPSPVLIRDGQALDLSAVAPTMSHLLDLRGLVPRLKKESFPLVGSVQALLEAQAFLAPVDLQPVKASGAT